MGRGWLRERVKEEGCGGGQLVGNGEQGLGLSQGSGYWRVVEFLIS